MVIHSFADDNDSVDEGELGPDNQSFTVWLSSIDDDNASGMLYDDIAQAKINLNSPGAEVDNFTVLSTDNDTALCCSPMATTVPVNPVPPETSVSGSRLSR